MNFTIIKYKEKASEYMNKEMGSKIVTLQDQANKLMARRNEITQELGQIKEQLLRIDGALGILVEFINIKKEEEVETEEEKEI